MDDRGERDGRELWLCSVLPTTEPDDSIARLARRPGADTIVASKVVESGSRRGGREWRTLGAIEADAGGGGDEGDEESFHDS
jgi:hypothetical protein